MEPQRAARPGVSHGDESTAPPLILWRPVFVIWSLLFTLGFGIMIAVTPQTRIYEDIICRHNLGRDSFATPDTESLRPNYQQRPDEDFCKDPSIQDAVNELFGWQTFFDGIPGLLLAMYYGAMADSKGRRPVLIMSMLGQTVGAAWILFICWIEADVRLTWLSSLASVFGGGNTVFSAAAMMVLADATPESSRSRVFFYSNTCLIVGEMLGPPLGAILMNQNPWIPNIIGFLFMVLATGLTFLVPETLDMSKKPTAQQESSEYGLGTTDGFLGLATHAWKIMGFVFHDQALLLLVGSYFTVDFARETLSLVVRYVSTRFSLPLSQASYLISFRASGHLVTFAVLLPLLDTLLARRFRTSPRQKDLTLARVSILFVIAGFAVLVVTPSVTGVVFGIGIYTLGTGFQTATKSLLSSLVEPAMVGTIYTTLSLMDTVGALLAGPIDALVMKRSMRMEGIWKGLPFIFALVLCCLSALALVYVKVDTRTEVAAALDEEQVSLIHSDTGSLEDGDGSVRD